MSDKVRTFESGATRDTDEGKFDYESFLSPLVIERYGEYMHTNRIQADGTLRDGDNWQKGMGLPTFMKSLWRHFHAVWKQHRIMLTYRNESDFGMVVAANPDDLDDLEDHLCAILFNTSGYLLELLDHRDTATF